MKKILELFLTFFKIGLFTFGGGYAMLTLIDSEIVEKKKWLTADELSDIVAVAESTPGPIAINSATYIGYKRKGFLGSLVATLAVILPSLIIIYVISLFLSRFLEITIIAKAFNGIKCAVALLIANAAIKLFKNMKKDALNYALAISAFAVAFCTDFLAWNFSSIYLIIIGAVVGIGASAIINARGKKQAQGAAISENPTCVSGEGETQSKTAGGSNEEATDIENAYGEDVKDLKAESATKTEDDKKNDKEGEQL